MPNFVMRVSLSNRSNQYILTIYLLLIGRDFLSFSCLIDIVQGVKMLILITGAGRRLGLYLTEYFLTEGHSVIGVSRRSSEALITLKSRFENLSSIEIGEYNQEGFEKLKDAFSLSKLDVLINNASFYVSDDKGEIEALYPQFFNVHMLFPALLSKEYFDQSIYSEGCIINISDIFAEDPDEKSALYCSTKAGLENLTKSHAKKFSGKFRVNSIQPGPIKFLPEHDDLYRENVLSQNLIKKEGGFLPLLKAVNYLIGNDYVTGTQVKVDGGRFLKKW